MIRVWTILGFLMLLLNAGCTQTQLRINTMMQARTWTEMQYKQVLDNVAVFVSNPDSLPYFIGTGTGTSAVNDTVTPSTTLTWNPYSIMTEVFGLSANRQMNENWTLAPVYEADRLEAMRCAYQIAVYGNPKDPARCTELFNAYHLVQATYTDAGPNITYPVQTGWVHWGKKTDVPKNACYVGHHCKTYVWVTADGMEGLTNFTLAILKIAAILPKQPGMAYGPGTVPEYKNLYNPLQSQLFALPTVAPRR